LAGNEGNNFNARNIGLGSQLYWWSDGLQSQPKDQLNRWLDPYGFAAAQMLAVMNVSHSSLAFMVLLIN
jgi:hypothetical protein